MAGRAYWKGYLKLSLVSCPVKLFSATAASGNRISFNMLHKDTLNRVHAALSRSGARRSRAQPIW